MAERRARGAVQSAGFLPAHGRAASSWAARRNRVASSPKRAASWTPIGRPSLLHWRGHAHRRLAGLVEELGVGGVGQLAAAHLVERDVEQGVDREAGEQTHLNTLGAAHRELADLRRGAGQGRGQEEVVPLEERGHLAAGALHVLLRLQETRGARLPGDEREQPRRGLEVVGARLLLAGDLRGLLDEAGDAGGDREEIGPHHLGLRVHGGRLDDLVAEVAEELDGVVHGGDAVRVGLTRIQGVSREGDPELAGICADLFEPWARLGGDAVGLAGGGRVDRVEEGGAVADGSAQHVFLDEAAPRLPRERGHGHPAARGLEAEQATRGSRNTDRAAAVPAVRRGHHPRRDRRRGAAGAAARGAAGVPRVAAGLADLRLGDAHDAELGGVGLAEDLQPRRLVALGEHAAAARRACSS
jgi:hypothetical protein